MKQSLPFFIVIAATHLFGGVVEDVSPQRGKPVARIGWTDETGNERRLSEFSGYPLILLPIYTRCPGACIQNVDKLKEALANSSADPRQFRVLLFSFDAADGPAALSKYRRRENIPLGWSIGNASQSNVDALLDSIGVQVGRAGREFTHPNIVVFLDAKLRIAKWIYGTDYSGRDLDASLKVATGESNWIGQHAQLLYSLLLFAGSVLCVALCHCLAQFNSLRRSSSDGTAMHPTAAER